MKSDPLISEAMATYWTNFAKFGDPNGKGVPEWPAFTPRSHKVMYFQQQPKVGSVPDEKELNVLNQYFEWRRTKEGSDWANN